MSTTHSVVAKTDTKDATLHPEVLEFTSSLSLDKEMLRADLIGSLAHITMLSRQKLVPADAALSVHRGLVSMWNDAAKGALQLPNEEDVHMAVEAELARRVGAASRVLHSARSRNDQVATDLRLHVRESVIDASVRLATLVSAIVAYAKRDSNIVLPAYTHRQRAQPVSLAYWWASWGAGFIRDLETLEHALNATDVLALGVGANSGSSLGIDRFITKGLLGFSQMTLNGLDTVGDRDFALDALYASTRVMLRIGRLSTDLIDFSSQEFGFVNLGGAIACGSSMMPHKRNPDVFEILRGKSGTAIGDLTGLLAVVKGLPGGYNRDLQEDREVLLATCRRLPAAISVLTRALEHVSFDAERCAAAVSDGSTQATDLAEALVRQGVPFREAYGLVGAVVRSAREQKRSLASFSVAELSAIDKRLDASLATSLSAAEAVRRKESAGGTGPNSVAAQLDAMTQFINAARVRVQRMPSLASLFETLKESL